MQLQHVIENDICFLYINGSLAPNRVEGFIEYIQDLLENSSFKGIIMNLQGVSFISSSGIGLIMSSMQSFQQREIRLVLCGINSNIESIFLSTGIAHILEYYPSEEEALAVLNS